MDKVQNNKSAIQETYLKKERCVLQLKCDFSLLVLVYDDDDHHHVDGTRLRLWTAATNGPIVHPPGDIWAWRKTVDDIDWGNPTIRPP
jgi:hypothetical protein